MTSSSEDGSSGRFDDFVSTAFGGLAHDLNNIFTIVGSNAVFARKELPEDHQVQEDLSDISEVTERGVALVDLLRSIAGRLVLRSQVFDPAQVVGALGDRLKEAAGDSGIFIAIEEPLPSVEAERTRLENALVDVVSAVKATSGGVDRVGLTLRASARGARRGVLFAVSGLGDLLEKERVVELLNPYCVADNRKISGLEVAAARGFLVQSGGEMGIGEETGGTAVELWLPAVD